jgi:hypothetical protein
MIRRTRIRRGATLVEMLVAAAMSIMIMWLLTWCYQQGLASFSNTKSHADLMDQQRQVTSVMTRDLLADHFLTEDGKPNGGRMVRDQLPGSQPPKSGFFYAYSPGPTYDEGFDTDGFASTVSTNHVLQFTAILPGGPAEQMFNADVPFATASPIFGRAAEISYYLVQSGQTLGGTTLYNLIRRQRLCALTTDDQPAYNQMLSRQTPSPPYPIQPADAYEVMAVNPPIGANPPNVPTIFTLSNLTIQANRLNVSGPYRQISNYRIGEDILLSNVVSFEVKFTGSSTTGTWPRPLLNNPDYPYDNLPIGNGLTGTFDTATITTSKIRITGVQIRLRTHDTKSRTTRQTTTIINL